MITNFVSDMDSPVYGKEVNQKRVYTESEITMFKNVDKLYGGVIITDDQAAGRRYLKICKSEVYLLTLEGKIDWNMNNKLIIWRKVSLTRPVQVMDPGTHSMPNMLLGQEFKNHRDENFSCIYDTEEVGAYLGKSQ